MEENEPTIIQTDIGAKDGQSKCPKCGSTDISLNNKNGKLRCNFCRHEFEPEIADFGEKDLSQLEGEKMGSGAQDIIADTNDMVTFKCSSCGAEVVVDTSEATQARCHWCRNTLSVNQQIPNGAVPDVVLPFKIPKKDAQDSINQFVGKRKFFAHPVFRREFTSDNIMGVYLPYMIVDANAHASLKGQGEHQTRSYTVGSGDNRRTYYDADLYDVEREFDITIDDLTVESSKDKLDTQSKDKTNNIINSIMPFDTENSVKWDANYIKGYTSEKRDTNVDQLRNLVREQSKDVVRFSINNSLSFYDRGVRWDKEDLDVKGQQWKSAYLPVWLYSYQQKKGNKSLLHYVAVNARTKETMGSVPLHMPKLVFISILVELFSGIFAFFMARGTEKDWPWILLLAGVIYFAVIYGKYRNQGARYTYEKETKTSVTNLRKVDNFVKKEKGLSNSKMKNANNTKVSGVANKGLVGNLADSVKDNIPLK